VSLWKIPCRACEGVFALYEGDAPPKPTDVIGYATLRTPAGQRIARTDIIMCGSCHVVGHEYLGLPPETWTLYAA